MRSDQLQFDFDAPRNSPPAPARVAPPAPTPARLIELPCDPAEQGYVGWQQERRGLIAELEARFGLILNQQVRVTLYGFPGELTGRLSLEDLLPPSQPGQALRLRLGASSFAHTDIESCSLLASPA